MNGYDVRFNALRIVVVIPAYNEVQSIGRVIGDIPKWVNEVVVVDNGSTDGTGEVARACGATVVVAKERGYGAACLAGLGYLGVGDEVAGVGGVGGVGSGVGQAVDVVVFVDGDYADDLREMGEMVRPLVEREAEIVIGSRVLGEMERGAMTWAQRFGNWLACFLVRRLFGYRMTDLGPFRAVRMDALSALHMNDKTYGWTVQMQLRAIKQKLRMIEVPVRYRKRIGKSKISGTVKGVIGAGYKIITTIFREYVGRASTDGRVVVFSRYPVAGESKTRMIPAVGEDGAAGLQREMTKHVIGGLREGVSIDGEKRVEVFYTGGTVVQMGDVFGDEGVEYIAQCEGDLGAKMGGAFESCEGEAMVIVGADCPSCSGYVVRSALQLLNERKRGVGARLVVGPATDGGFYLIGTKYFDKTLFAGMTWGHEGVLADLLKNAKGLGYEVRFLPTRNDVDEPEDLIHWEKAKWFCGNEKRKVRVSIIIPTRNEAKHLPRTLKRLRPMMDEIEEVIVVDGGSTDNTPRIAEKHGVKLVYAAAGRGVQMNEGARHATGDMLLFLHADTLLPEGFVDEVRRILEDEQHAVGAFSFGVKEEGGWGRFRGRWYRLIAMCVNLRSRWREMPYGDQALFMRRGTFETLGGFDEVSMMEDYLMVKKAQRVGKIVTSRLRVETSTRQWENTGVLWASVKNVTTVWGYRLGVPMKWLVWWRNGK